MKTQVDTAATPIWPDEMQRIIGQGRCKGCGHLNVEHNFHCCVFCTIEGCTCEWGMLKEQRDAQDRKWEEEAKARAANEITPGVFYSTGTDDNVTARKM